MKNILFVFFLLTTVVFTSCNKDKISGGSWNFKGTNYITYSCFGDPSSGALDVSTNGTNSPNSNMTITFGNSAPFYGTDTGNFTVVNMLNGNFPTGGHQIGIALSCPAGVYNTSGGNGNGSQATAHVTYSNGKVSVSGIAIEMVNVAPPYDSATLSLSITQLQ